LERPKPEAEFRAIEEEEEDYFYFTAANKLFVNKASRFV
jgi:hypothetical protein